MAQSISAVNASLPLSSDRSSFISKPLPSTFLKLVKQKPNYNGCRSIVSMAGDGRGGDLDHLQRVSVRPQQAQPKRRIEAAPVGLWDRFPTARTMQQMMETMDRMIEDPAAYAVSYTPPPPPAQNGSYSRGRTPWEIKEAESEYKMRFDMPGMTREDVKVWVEEKMLVVQAEKTPRKQKQADNNRSTTATATATATPVNGSAVESEEEEEEWPAKSFGRYKTRIALPENVQFEKIKAEVKDGVLYITVPKATVSAKVLDIAVQ
ncbi:hypothetical protein QQ045_018227 [Rhodiola kirilowii]